MSKSAKKESQDGILPVIFWIFFVAALLVLFILTMTLLDRNGTLARVKEQFAEWREEREAARREKEAGKKTVTYFGPSGIAEYESWFADGAWGDIGIGDTLSGENNAQGTAPAEPLRQEITVSPVNGKESWWADAKKLSGSVALYAQAETPLYGAPDAKGKVFGYTAAGEAFRLFAVFEDGWYVVTDGRFYYCSEGTHYTMVQPENPDLEAVLAVREPRVTRTVGEILQNPELPHGCEVTALAMLLSYYGCSADKCVLADKWLQKGEWGSTDFNKAFVGNPRKLTSSAGCYAPVLEDTANRYLQAAGSTLTAESGRGVSFEELLSMLEEAPVLTWTTMELKAPYIAQIWTVDGEELYWQNCEHCVVLTGYDLEKGVFYGMDPLYGACEYDMRLFFLRFQTMYSQVLQVRDSVGRSADAHGSAKE